MKKLVLIFGAGAALVCGSGLANAQGWAPRPFPPMGMHGPVIITAPLPVPAGPYFGPAPMPTPGFPSNGLGNDPGAVGQNLDPLARCLIATRGDIENCGSKAAMSMLPPDGQRVAECLLATGGDIERCGAREAMRFLPPQAQRVVSCLARTGGDVVECGTREAMNFLPPDGRRIAGCLAATGGNVVACGIREGVNELDKCRNGIGVSGGCFGPGGEGRKIVQNNIVGPVGDVISGTIGQSDQSVWRKAGLPKIKLW